MRLNWYQVCVLAPPTCVRKLHQNRAVGIVAIHVMDDPAELCPTRLQQVEPHREGDPMTKRSENGKRKATLEPSTTSIVTNHLCGPTERKVEF